MAVFEAVGRGSIPRRGTLYLFSECAGFARESAKLEDQFHFLAEHSATEEQTSDTLPALPGCGEAPPEVTGILKDDCAKALVLRLLAVRPPVSCGVYTSIS